MALILNKILVYKIHFCPKSFRIPNNVAYFSFRKQKDYQKCYKILGIDENSDQDQIRHAYLNLVKKYHPDSGTEEANADKFQEIDEAFRTLIAKKSEERSNLVEEAIIQEQNIKHTAPQHRQYLSFEGVGSGNIFQREKQYSKVRAMQAVENVYNHRVAKVTADDKALMQKVPLKHKIKTKYGFERLVEDLIQESMSKGEFNNLKNIGKPLPGQNRDPYVDFVTHKINEVLIENGFTPEWILLQKEIREEANRLRKDLFSERQYFGPYPLTVEENIEWSNKVYSYKNIVEKINKKIAKFNLLVPVLNKQMIQICLEREAQKAMVDGQSYEDVRFDRTSGQNKQISTTDSSPAGTVNLFTFIDLIFKGSK